MPPHRNITSLKRPTTLYRTSLVSGIGKKMFYTYFYVLSIKAWYLKLSSVCYRVWSPDLSPLAALCWVTVSISHNRAAIAPTFGQPARPDNSNSALSRSFPSYVPLFSPIFSTAPTFIPFLLFSYYYYFLLCIFRVSSRPRPFLGSFSFFWLQSFVRRYWRSCGQEDWFFLMNSFIRETIINTENGDCYGGKKIVLMILFLRTRFPFVSLFEYFS